MRDVHNRSVRFSWSLWPVLSFVAIPAVAILHGSGCFTTSSPASNGGGATGGSSAGGSVPAANGGSGGSISCDAADCSDPCAGVVCPAGSFCTETGKCDSIPSCEAGTDCTQCPDLTSCAGCNSILHAEGWPIFNALRFCVSCTACYYSCGGADVAGFNGGNYCSAPPANVDPCDGDAGCSACSTCATMGQATCAAQDNACVDDMDCTALIAAIPMCPGPSDAGPGPTDAGPG